MFFIMPKTKERSDFETKVKPKAMRILKKSGISQAALLRNRLEEIAATGEVSVYREPNAETERAMKNVRSGRNLKTASSVDDMFNEILGENWDK